MIHKLIEKILILYNKDTFRKIFTSICLCIVILYISFTIIDNYPKKYKPGPTFKEKMLDNGLQEIIFSFDKNIISFSSYEESVKEWSNILQLRTEPETKGSIRTISGNKFAYIFDEPIAKNISISIFYNTNIYSIKNEPVTTEINYQISKSSPFILENISSQINYATRANNDLYSDIYLFANTPITLKKLRKALTISNDSRCIFYKLSYMIETNQLTISTIETNYQKICISLFGLKANSDYELSVDQSKLNNSSNIHKFSYKFTTYPKPYWIGLYTNILRQPMNNLDINRKEASDNTFSEILSENDSSIHSFFVGDEIWLKNINPILVKNKNFSTLSADPPVKNLKYEIQRDGIKISGEFEGNKKYELTFEPEKLKDIYGQKITNSFRETIKIKHKEAVIQQVKDLLIIHKDNPIIPIQVLNVTNIKISYQTINSIYYTALAFNNKYIPLPIQHTNITLSPPIDEITWVNLDISELTGKKSMLLLMNIQNNDNIDNSSEFTKVLTTENCLFAHISIGDMLFYASSYYSQKPIENMMISIWDPVRGSFQDLGRTTSEGFLRVPNPKLPLESLEKPIFIGLTEDNNNNITFLGKGNTDFETIDNKSFYYSCQLIWNNINEGHEVNSVLFTERPIYKPGETIHIHALARGKMNNQFSSETPFFKQPINMKILSPSYKEMTNIHTYWSDFGSLNLEYPTEYTNEAGRYIIQLISQNTNILEQTFFNLEHLIPSKAEINISTSDVYYYKDKIDFSITPKFLSGEEIEMPIEYSVTSHPMVYESSKFPNHYFNSIEIMKPYHVAFEDNNTIIAKKVKKVLGKKISMPLKQNFANNARLQITASGKLDNIIGLYGTNENIKIYTPSQLGIAATKSVFTNNEPVNLNLISIDPLSEKIQTNIPVTLSVFHHTNFNLGILSFLTNYISINTKIEQNVLNKKLSLGQKDFTFLPKKAGYYRARLETSNKGINSLSEVDFHVLNKNESHDNQKELSITSDKSLYQSGDNAIIYIENPFEYSSILVTVERDSIREYYTLKSHDNVISHSIPLTYSDEPGLNITAFVNSIPKNRNNTYSDPEFRYGSIALKIKPIHKTLTINIDQKSQNYNPGDKVELELSASLLQKKINGKAIVAVRDKSVLNILPDNIPHLIERFYSSRPFNFTTWSSGVLLSETTKLTNILSNDELSRPMFAKNMQRYQTLGIKDTILDNIVIRSNIQYTIFYNGEIDLSNNKKSKVSFTLPDNISGFDITVLAYDKNELFGVTNISFTTSKSFIVDPILPDFVRPGDIVTWGAFLRNFTPENLSFKTILNNQIENFETNIIVPANSSILITNTTAITTDMPNISWFISSVSEEISDAFAHKVPVISKSTPWFTSSYSGMVNFETNITIEPYIKADLKMEKLNLSVSPYPAIKIKDTLEKIITSQSLYIENIIKRILTIAGNEELLSRRKITDFTKSELFDLVKKDLEQLKNYKIETNSIAMTPSGLLYSDSQMLVLKIYESLLKAKNANYEIDKEILKIVSSRAQKYIKHRNTMTNKVIPAYALKLLALDKIIDKDNFQLIYPSLSGDLESQALILDTMHILGFSLETISLQTAAILEKTSENAHNIAIPKKSGIIPYTLIKYYGTIEDNYKIINKLDPENPDYISSFLEFSKKYKYIYIYPTHMNINNQDFILTEQKTSMELNITNNQSLMNIDIKTKNPHIFFCINYSYLREHSIDFLNAGYNIQKRILDLDENTITNDKLEWGFNYIVELEITPNNRSQESVEIIDPLYGGVHLSPDNKQKKYLQNHFYQYYQDRIHIFTKLSGQKKHKIRYLIIAGIPGKWTASPSAIYGLKNPEVFGYQSQPQIIIE